jgi:hypothetical protein
LIITINDTCAQLVPATFPWLSRSVILPKTSLKGLILIIKSTYQAWYLPLLHNRSSEEDRVEGGGASLCSCDALCASAAQEHLGYTIFLMYSLY